MKLTIIPIDNAVYVDGEFLGDLDLSSCSIPTNVHALQWDSNYGWIEFVQSNLSIPKPLNEEITALPTWANCCVSVWQEQKDKNTDLIITEDKQIT